jgi:glycosyltransferase involved in cell wall biosynthesis
VQVINNGINLSVFYPRESEFRKKYSIEDKFIILGVAFDWGVRKGLDIFVKLAKMLDDRFQIVLVDGTEYYFGFNAFLLQNCIIDFGGPLQMLLVVSDQKEAFGSAKKSSGNII